MKWKNWLVKKLGGQILTKEEEAILLPYTVKRIMKLAKERMKEDNKKMIKNSWK